MKRLADDSGDTVFLLIRSGLDGVCLDRHEGLFPIKVLTLNVGMRRPLGASAGAVALLMNMPEPQATAILQANNKRFLQFKIPPQVAAETLKEANHQGFAINNELTIRGQRGVAVPCLNPEGQPIAALSIAAITRRMTRARLPELVSLLKEEARHIEQQYAMLSNGSSPTIRKVY